MTAQQYLYLMAKLGKRHWQMMETTVWPLDKVALLGVALGKEQQAQE